MESNLCQKQGLVYYLSSLLSDFSLAGTLDIIFSVSPNNFKEVLREIIMEIRKLKSSKVLEKELLRAKIQLERNLKFSLDTPEGLSEIFGLDLLLNKTKTLKERLREIREITIEDIQNTARKIFTPENLNLVVVGPFNKEQRKKSEEIIALLR